MKAENVRPESRSDLLEFRLKIDNCIKREYSGERAWRGECLEGIEPNTCGRAATNRGVTIFGCFHQNAVRERGHTRPNVIDAASPLSAPHTLFLSLVPRRARQRAAERALIAKPWICQRRSVTSLQ